MTDVRNESRSRRVLDSAAELLLRWSDRRVRFRTKDALFLTVLLRAHESPETPGVDVPAGMAAEISAPTSRRDGPTGWVPMPGSHRLTALPVRLR